MWSIDLYYHCKQDFIARKGYPNWTNVTQVLEGAETPLFKQNFSDWLNKDESKGYSMPQGKNGKQ